MHQDFSFGNFNYLQPERTQFRSASIKPPFLSKLKQRERERQKQIACLIYTDSYIYVYTEGDSE